MKWRIVGILLSAGVLAFAGDPQTEPALKGLKTVSVAVEYPNQEFEPEGLTRAVLQQQIEERLRAAGFTIDPSAREFVALSVNAWRGKRPPHAVALELGVYQIAELTREKIKTVAQTWQTSDILLAAPKSLKAESLHALDNLIGRLLSAWRSANPQ